MSNVVDLSEVKQRAVEETAAADCRAAMWQALTDMDDDALIEVIHAATRALDREPMYDWLSEEKPLLACWLAQVHDQGDCDEFLLEAIQRLHGVEDDSLDLFSLLHTLSHPLLRFGERRGRLRKLALELVCCEDGEEDAKLAALVHAHGLAFSGGSAAM